MLDAAPEGLLQVNRGMDAISLTLSYTAIIVISSFTARILEI